MASLAYLSMRSSKSLIAVWGPVVRWRANSASFWRVHTYAPHAYKQLVLVPMLPMPASTGTLLLPGSSAYIVLSDSLPLQCFLGGARVVYKTAFPETYNDPRCGQAMSWSFMRCCTPAALLAEFPFDLTDMLRFVNSQQRRLRTMQLSLAMGLLATVPPLPPPLTLHCGNGHSAPM